MGRTSTIKPAVAGKLNRALARSKGSEKNILEIYNALQESEDTVAPGPFKRLVRQRLAPALECFEAREFPVGNSEEMQVVYLPKLRLLLNFLASESPAWGYALFNALRAQGNEVAYTFPHTRRYSRGDEGGYRYAKSIAKHANGTGREGGCRQRHIMQQCCKETPTDAAVKTDGRGRAGGCRRRNAINTASTTRQRPEASLEECYEVFIFVQKIKPQRLH